MMTSSRREKEEPRMDTLPFRLCDTEKTDHSEEAYPAISFTHSTL